MSSKIASYTLRRSSLPGAIGVTLLVQSIISLLSASIPVLGPAIAADRGWNVTVIAFYPTLALATAFIISFQIPTLIMRLGGMGLSLSCIGVSAIGILCATSPALELVVVSPIAIGMAAGAMNPASSQVLSPRTPSHLTGLVMSVKQTGVPLGAALAGMLLPFFVLRFGWKIAAVGLAFGSAAIGIALVPTIRWLNGSLPTRPARYRPLEPLKRLLAMPGMPQFLLAGMAAGTAQYCLRSFYTVYLVNEVGLDLSTAGLIFGVSQGAGIFGQIAWASLSDRVLKPNVAMGLIGFTIAAASFLSAMFTHDWSLVGIMFAATLFGASASGFIPVVLAEIARKAPQGEVGALTSGANVFLIAGAAIGPLLFGGVAAYMSYPAAFVTLAVFTFATGTIAIKT